MHDQFLVHPYYFDIPLKEVGRHALSWFTFGFEPFNTGIGVVQTITAILLLFRRTALIGAIFYFFMLSSIMLIIVTYLEGWNSLVMISKVSFMMLINLYLIYYYKKEIIEFWKLFSNKLPTQKFSIKWLIYVFVGMILLNCLSIFPKYLYVIFTDPTHIVDTFLFDLKESYGLYRDIFNRFF